ncbi:hypothetical protein RCD94_24485 [Klebsiella pneumoniae]|nr:hypothetical protein [Klebsiella pneumoniae]
MTTDITELAQSLKAAADREMICRDGAETSEIWERTVTPENILALVEALEKAQETIAFQQGEIKALLSSLESRIVKLPKKNIGWDRGEEDCWNNAIDACAEVLAAAGIKVEVE